MARIRSVKPEFWDDRKLARSVTRDARLLYIGLWNQSDEHSRLNGDELWIKGRVFPYDDDIGTVEVFNLLLELELAGRIQRYEIDGDPFIFLPKLAKHQRLEPKVESRLPEPPEPGADESAHPTQTRANKSASDADESSLLYVAGGREQVAGSRGPGDTARGTRLPDDWTPDADLIESMRAAGVPDALARQELPKFRDYWTAQPGAKGRKANWPGTWRNWLRRAMESQARAPAGVAARAGLERTLQQMEAMP